MSKQPGFIPVTLLKEHKKEAVNQMGIRFRSLETAATWRDPADHKALSPKIKALYKESTVQVYEVILEKQKADGRMPKADGNVREKMEGVTRIWTE
jgi:antibiotic biosynthesis monooxygenase (ABM) superfamily enzyme